MKAQSGPGAAYIPGMNFRLTQRTLVTISVLFLIILIGLIGWSQKFGIKERGINQQKLSNPAAVYCQDMGYEYETVKGEDGEYGVCHLPEENSCDAWEFLDGSCGQEYSCCAQQGYQIKTKNDGQNPYSATYGVCVNDKGAEIGSVVELSLLEEKAMGCQGEGNGQGEKPVIDSGLAYQPSDTLPPTSFDWRNNSGDWTTPVRDQGQCGSCWAFSAVGVVEAVKNIQAGNPALDLDLSEQYLVSDCDYDSGSCCGGWHNSALGYIRDYGLPDESCMPYVDGSECTCYSSCGDSVSCTYSSYPACSDRTCSDRCADWQSRRQYITNLGSVSSDPTTIKQALVDNGPLGVALDMDGGFDGSNIFRCPSGDESIDHAVSIVGYDDVGGYWIARNSWGNTWGPQGDGSFRVGYGECEIEEYVYYADATPVTAPANDNMSSAINITSLPYTNSQSTVGATLEEGEPDYDCGVGAASVWYTYTPGSSGLFDVDTAGSAYDTVLHVFENLGGGMYSLVSCGDVYSGSQSRTVFYGNSGIQYLIGVTDYNYSVWESEQPDVRIKDQVASIVDQAGDSDRVQIGGNLTLSMDSYSCPADRICASVVDHDGYPAYPVLHVYDMGGIKVDREYSTMIGYVESDPLPPGTYNVDLIGPGFFISETGWSLGIHTASAESLPPFIISAEDRFSNPTIYGNIFLGKGETNDLVGGFDEGGSDRVYVTPGTYDVLILDYWDQDYALYVEDHVVGGGGGSLTLDASSMPLDTVTFNWDGFSNGKAWIPAFDNYLYKMEYLSSGHTLYVSNPDTSYTLGAELVMWDGSDCWYYDFFDCCQVTGSPGQTVAFTVGGALTTDLNPLNDQYYQGDTGSLRVTVQDAHGNVLKDVYYYDYSTAPLVSEPGEDKIKQHPKPRQGTGKYLPRIRENGTGSTPAGDLSQTGYFYPLPVYTVKDALSNPISGSLAYSYFSAPYEFSVPDPANLGTWSGEVDVEFGPYQSNGTDTVNFEVYDEPAPPADFDADGDTDISIFRPSTGYWYASGGVPVWGGALTDWPVPGDYDGDTFTDVAIWRPSNGYWYIKDPGAYTYSIEWWGFAGDIPFPADYDGDGDTDIAVFRPSSGFWYIKGGDTVQWGTDTDVPVPCDYDGDGATDIAVFRPSTGYWLIEGQTPFWWGAPTDIPVPGDYDGDGDCDAAIWRPSNGYWYVKHDTGYTYDIEWYGFSTDIPVPADYDGDGDTDFAVVRPSSGYWYVLDPAITEWYYSPGDFILPIRDSNGDGDPWH